VLLGNRADLPRAQLDRPRQHHVRVVDDQQHPGRRPADRRWREIAVRRRLVLDPELCVTDCELSDNLNLVLAEPEKLDRPERGLVERNRVSAASY